MSGRGAPPLSRAERRDAPGRRGATVWFTGTPAAGKTTLAAAVERALVETSHSAYRLDGDEVRRDLCSDLGFDRRGRAENVRRIAHAARLLADAGVLVLVALVSPYAADREDARQLHEVLDIPFVEVFLDTPITICERRDPKGMYSRARRGEIANFTGVNDPYERPENPDVRISPASIEHSARLVLDTLSRFDII
jgi:bifunctional enzyme CysN/CysC